MSVLRLVKLFNPRIYSGDNEESLELLINDTIPRIKFRPINRHLNDALFKVINKGGRRHCRENDVTQRAFLRDTKCPQEQAHEGILMRFKFIRIKLIQSSGSNITGELVLLDTPQLHCHQHDILIKPIWV